jgi:hypothetical protein
MYISPFKTTYWRLGNIHVSWQLVVTSKLEKVSKVSKICVAWFHRKLKTNKQKDWVKCLSLTGHKAPWKSTELLEWIPDESL